MSKLDWVKLENYFSYVHCNGIEDLCLMSLWRYAIEYNAQLYFALPRGMCGDTLSNLADGAIVALDTINISARRLYTRHNNNNATVNTVIAFDIGFVEINITHKEYNLYIGSTNEIAFNKLLDYFADKLESDVKPGTVSAVLGDSSDIDIVKVGSINKTLCRDNYDDRALKAYDHIKADLVSDSPCGRLVIISGPSGTGKTYFVRGLISECHAEFVFVPPSLITELAGPALLKLLFDRRSESSEDAVYYKRRLLPGTRNNSKSFVLVVEDADQCLIPRGSDNANSVTTLLNFCDGMFGELLNLRIIATTNAKNMEIDSALRRNGRLCRLVHVDKLSKEHAFRILNRLKPDWVLPFGSIDKESISLADIYALARDAE